jgi:hypothetical protein
MITNRKGKVIEIALSLNQTGKVNIPLNQPGRQSLFQIQVKLQGSRNLLPGRKIAGDLGRAVVQKMIPTGSHLIVRSLPTKVQGSPINRLRLPDLQDQPVRVNHTGLLDQKSHLQVIRHHQSQVAVEIVQVQEVQVLQAIDLQEQGLQAQDLPARNLQAADLQDEDKILIIINKWGSVKLPHFLSSFFPLKQLKKALSLT